MSWRTLLEFNHDLCPRDPDVATFGAALRTYMRSGDPKLLPDGVTFLQRRHHSEAEPKGWVPPQIREDGFECLAFMAGGWHVAYWDAERFIWLGDGMSVISSRQNPPTAFLPMPEVPTP